MLRCSIIIYLDHKWLINKVNDRLTKILQGAKEGASSVFKIQRLLKKILITISIKQTIGYPKIKIKICLFTYLVQVF